MKILPLVSSCSFAALALIACQPDTKVAVADRKDIPDWVSTAAICQPEQLFEGCDLGAGWTLQLRPSYAPAEQLLQLTLRPANSASLAISRSYLEGVNMYMGKLPVVWRAIGGEQGYQAELRLGLCAQPFMHWRLIVEELNGERITAEFVGYPPAFASFD